MWIGEGAGSITATIYGGFFLEGLNAIFLLAFILNAVSEGNSTHIVSV